MDVSTIAPRSLRGGRRVALGLVLAALLAGVGVAAPTTLAQRTPGPTEPQANPYTPFDLRTNGSAYLCAGRAEPRDVAPFLRTELYFGTNKDDGSVVSEQEFLGFVDRQITPRFPDGLTLVTALGQFRGSRGIERERSMLLILLYPVDTARSSGQKIEEIRRAYIGEFRQESVLRADEPLSECVSF
jgi:hypothetical protein